MHTLLDLTNGISWCIVYILAIIFGIKNKTWFIPKIAICQNFSWEFLMVLNRFLAGETYSIAFIIQLIWLILDAVILGSWIYLDRNKPFKLIQNIALSFLVFTAMFFLAYLAGEWEFSAFLINVIMSAAFVFRERKNIHAPCSVMIATCKLIGTLAATILSGIIYWDPLILWLGGICFILDIYYLAMISGKHTHSR